MSGRKTLQPRYSEGKSLVLVTYVWDQPLFSIIGGSSLNSPLRKNRLEKKWLKTEAGRRSYHCAGALNKSPNKEHVSTERSPFPLFGMKSNFACFISCNVSGPTFSLKQDRCERSL
jgi:hypothetical protein